nr:hypothetical protein Iba_chr11dCG12720 [Ipomoea batatas]
MGTSRRRAPSPRDHSSCIRDNSHPVEEGVGLFLPRVPTTYSI